MRIAFVVRGCVQGVGCRRFAQRTAESLGVAGFVRNRPDGTVEGEAESDAAALQQFLAALRQGPRLSKVLAVDTVPLPAAGIGGFSIQ
jgi:acylphosphatase